MIPVNETHVDSGVNASQCADGVDTLQVSWGNNNSFMMTFEQNKTSETVKYYDLSMFVINLNVSGLFNDSAGEMRCDEIMQHECELFFPHCSESVSGAQVHARQGLR